MIIRKKIDALHFLEKFQEIASFDDKNSKLYFIFADKIRGGQYTLMKKDDIWSTHGKGEYYCDLSETYLNDIDELIDFIWFHRGKINQSLKELQIDTILV
ncbi:hypothetical protein [Bacillus sp. Marseille-P3661]|uniref:hypothetical protein n=1 Tax=Bacillus sp. Marseille-P3661 TaxID=1936234 RepID=UPI000C8498A0|nr:hypothetical protein [Bacillus sp. Marseille-P3661]